MVISASGNGAVQFQLAAFQLLIDNAHFEPKMAHLLLVRPLDPGVSALMAVGWGAGYDLESRIKATIAMTNQVRAIILVNMRVIQPVPPVQTH